MYVQHLQELQEAPLQVPRCDLCTDTEKAMKHCEVCGCYLCEFCVQAHHRQRRTSDHLLMPVDELTDGIQDGLRLESSARGSILEPVYCELHPSEVLSVFCEDCKVPVCNVCTVDEHIDHTVSQLDDVNLQYSDTLKNLLAQAKPLVTMLNEAIRKVEFTMDNVREQAKSVADEICGTIDAQMKALQEHKRSLLNELEAIKRHKENTLDLQMESLKKVLETVTVNSSLAHKALREGHAIAAFSTRTQVVSHLEEVLSTKHDLLPMEDDYIRFCCDAPAGAYRGFDVVGVLDSRGPSASHSVVEGGGLFDARQGNTASFTVIVHDRYGQKRETGGDKVEAHLSSRSGALVSTVIEDCGDGTYHVIYSPESIGEHRLSVLVSGKHVRASPFIVNVFPKRNKHFGTFHCCTFCSTKGQKHVRCGCGGTMPGGYSGCGHGHPGHPGCWHWSCCGSNEENSECLL